MIKSKIDSYTPDISLVEKDLKLVEQLSEAMQEDIGGHSKKDIERAHRNHFEDNLKDTIKKGYNLKDEIAELSKTATSYSEIFNKINPII